MGNKTHIIVQALVLTMALSCSTRHPSLPEVLPNDTEASIDSIAVRQEVNSFPDTMLPSAEALFYRIDTFAKEAVPSFEGSEDFYQDADGIFTFRGSPSRNPNFFGRLHSDSLHITVDWVFETAIDTTLTSHGRWGGGTGWTGQPLYIHWPDSIISQFKRANDTLFSRITPQELVVASLCGQIYFLDFRTGQETRPSIDTRNVLKGTPSIHPLLNGNLYVGHGVPKSGPFGHIVFDLYQHKQKQFFGKDRSAWRRWGAYDSSPLVLGGFLFRPGENGTLYKYLIEADTLRLQSTFRYSLSPHKYSYGIESSLAACRNYGYIADNMGNIICLNLNTLKPVWHYRNHDDTDATPVIDMEEGIPYLYTGCEVDRQGSAGYSYFLKINGLTGEIIWEDTLRGRRIFFNEKILDGGMYSSPLLGGGDCSDMIFSNFCTNTLSEKGCLVAFDKKDGSIRYKTQTKQYSWSSPVAFYNDQDEMFLFTGDAAGYGYLIKGKTGEIVASKRIGSNFESSPIIVDDKIIIGSRGNKIFRISLE